MGGEEQAPVNGTVVAETPAADTNGNSPPVQEEPPKIEDIITPVVLEKIINSYNPNLSLVSWKAELGSKIGDNYMSILYAVEIQLEGKNGEKETLEVMLKTLPTNLFQKDAINDMQAFNVEATVYHDVHPMLIAVQRENGVPEDQLLRSWPKCYAAHLDGQTDYLAMENLRLSGFKVGNRMVGLDFNHCSSVLRSLAKYHAISYAKFGGSQEKIQETFPLLDNHLFSKDSASAEINQQWFTQSFKTLEEALKKAGEEVASSRLGKLAQVDGISYIGDLVNKNIECAVISHGDCWVNNIMFKYNEDDPKTSAPVAVKFIDFQLSVATSRLIDIYYFFMTSVQLDVLNEREQDLLMIYFAEFTSYAERLGVNTKERGLTWEKFLEEGDRYRFYGVYMGLILAPMFAAESADIPDMNSFKKEDFENPEDASEAMKKFCKDLTNEKVNIKVKNLLMDHLPRCSIGREFL